MSDPGIAMSQLRIAEAAWCMQKKQVEQLAVVGHPEIPNPMVRQCECHLTLPPPETNGGS